MGPVPLIQASEVKGVQWPGADGQWATSCSAHAQPHQASGSNPALETEAPGFAHSQEGQRVYVQPGWCPGVDLRVTHAVRPTGASVVPQANVPSREQVRELDQGRASVTKPRARGRVSRTWRLLGTGSAEGPRPQLHKPSAVRSCSPAGQWGPGPSGQKGPHSRTEPQLGEEGREAGPQPLPDGPAVTQRGGLCRCPPDGCRGCLDDRHRTSGQVARRGTYRPSGLRRPPRTGSCPC